MCPWPLKQTQTHRRPYQMNRSRQKLKIHFWGRGQRVHYQFPPSWFGCRRGPALVSGGRNYQKRGTAAVIFQVPCDLRCSAASSSRRWRDPAEVQKYLRERGANPPGRASVKCENTQAHARLCLHSPTQGSPFFPSLVSEHNAAFRHKSSPLHLQNIVETGFCRSFGVKCAEPSDGIALQAQNLLRYRCSGFLS